MHSIAIYDLVSATLRGQPALAEVEGRALAAPTALWERVLAFEGCAVQFDRALRDANVASRIPPSLRQILRDATSTALSRAILVHQQLPEIAALAATHGVRVLALKGAARLLAGEVAGTRSISDIDILVSPADATRFHTLMRKALGYSASGTGYSHHLPGLTRPRSLGIEVHFRLSDATLPLDADIWWETRRITLGAHAIEIPSPTDQMLHAMEHAIRLNWTSRYRLRDITDVATLFGDDVSIDAVRRHVEDSTMRTPFETLLSAAHELNPRIPCTRRNAGQTVRRVARTRLAIAAMPRRPIAAERVYRYAGLVAEGSAPALARAGWGLARRLRTAVFASGMLLLSGCLESTTAPPAAVPPPPFVFVSDPDGIRGVYRFEEGVVTRLSGPTDEDEQPHSAAGKIVFTTWRHVNAEVYIADLALGNQQRLTIGSSFDGEPALDPSGTTVAFVSSRSGTPRIWLMDATGANPRALATGSTTFVPEVAPRWSPTGDRIAFTSTRTGTSQVFVVSAAGGSAEQLSHESGGAFTPAWMNNGTSIVYMALSGGPRLAVITASGGNPTAYTTHAEGLSEPTCDATACLASSGPVGGPGDIVFIRRAGGAAETLTPAGGNDRRPAILVP